MNNTVCGSMICGWNNDYLRLKRYRHIRNLISHENNCDEESLTTPDDAYWIDNFCSRILDREDPLALYEKNKKTRSNSNSHEEVKRQRNENNFNTSKNGCGKDNFSNKCKKICVAVFLIGIIVMFFYLLLKY